MEGSAGSILIPLDEGEMAISAVTVAEVMTDRGRRIRTFYHGDPPQWDKVKLLYIGLRREGMVLDGMWEQP